MSTAESQWREGVEIREENAGYAIYHPKSIKKAIKKFDKSLKIDPDYYQAYADRGLSYYYQRKDKKALADLHHCLELNPTSTDAYTSIGMVYTRQEQYEKAYKHYIKGMPNDQHGRMIGFYNLGSHFDDLEEYDMAIRMYSAAIQLNTNDAPNYNNRGHTKLKSGKYQEAIADFNKAISLDAKYKLAINGRGMAQHYLGNYEQAIVDFSKVLSIDMKALEKTHENTYSVRKFAFNNMANSYFEQGNVEGACIHWNKAIKDGYEYKPEWKRIWKIEDPALLIKRNCE